jgi:hypothetical protein
MIKKNIYIYIQHRDSQKIIRYICLLVKNHVNLCGLRKLNSI